MSMLQPLSNISALTFSFLFFLAFNLAWAPMAAHSLLKNIERISRRYFVTKL